MWYNSIASASTGLVPNALALFNSRRVAPTVYPGGREQAGRGFAVSIATWRVYRRPGQPGGSFTGRRNAPAFTSASTPALSGKTVERWVDPLGLHFTKTLVPTLRRPFRRRRRGWTHWVYLYISQKRMEQTNYQRYQLVLSALGFGRRKSKHVGTPSPDQRKAPLTPIAPLYHVSRCLSLSRRAP